jgi:hypothetical protein
LAVTAFVLVILAGVGIGVGAYDAGLDEGIRRGLASAEGGAQVVEVVGRDRPGVFFPGFFFFTFVLIGGALLLRAAFRPRWGGPWGHGPWRHGHGGPWNEEGRARFEEKAREWHERQHEGAAEPPGSGVA